MPLRAFRAVFIALIITVIVMPEASAQWPATCVELNDIVESHLGNESNVGIYQTTFGDEAEAACRSDHEDDVLYAFNWVLGGAAPATPDMHIAYESVVAVAMARGAPDYAAGAIAAEVVMNGNVNAYLHGTHPEIPFGEHNCHLQSAECPLASPHPYHFHWTWRRLADDGQCSRWSVQVDITNRTPDQLHVSWLLIKFLDNAGFVLDTLALADIHVSPESTHHLSELKSICGSNRNEVDSVDTDPRIA